MLLFEPYCNQMENWPKSGLHILAQYDSDSIVVYQAYRPSIGHFASTHGYFGGEFSYSRMSWIKPNFLWMMNRSGWGNKPGQKITLAIRLRRAFFDDLLAQSVESLYNPIQYASLSEWKRALITSSVRRQWDPDHSPGGTALPRRAIQLGLRGRVLKDYGRHQILEITDLSSFVAEQRENRASEKRGKLITPLERVYLPADPSIQSRLQLSDINHSDEANNAQPE